MNTSHRLLALGLAAALTLTPGAALSAPQTAAPPAPAATDTGAADSVGGEQPEATHQSVALSAAADEDGSAVVSEPQGSSDGTAGHGSAEDPAGVDPDGHDPDSHDPDSHDQDGQEGVDRTATLSLGEGVHVVGVRWEGPVPDVAEMRLREEGQGWGEWQHFDGAVEAGQAGAGVEDTQDDTMATEAAVVVGAAEVQVRVSGEVADASVESWSTTATSDDARRVANLPLSAGRLVVGTRDDWGANEALRGTRPDRLISSAPKLGVTIHHTAGVNGYRSDEVPAILRGIFAYHAQTLGWGDIGYGALVDRFGRVWEGRAGGLEHNVQLAHSLGMNRDWAGVSVLGNHDTATVDNRELAALSELTAWTLDLHGVRVTDRISYRNASLGWTRTLPAVHGHKDVYPTACPGHHLYKLLDLVRTTVGGHQARGTHAVQRIGGADRYESAALLARRAFMEGTGTAYITSGEGVVDALAVGPLAAAQGAATLLTRKDTVPQSTLDALTRLGVKKVRIVGGVAAVSSAVEKTLTDRGLTVERVAGTNRYAVAARLSTEVASGGKWSGTVYLASGEALADALGGSAAAAEQDAAMMLTQRGKLPAATAEALASSRPSRVVVLGGPSVVSSTVLSQVRTALPNAVVERWGGSNRYETSALVATNAFDTARSAVAAAGDAPTDAMVGAQLAARHGSPVVLVRPGCRPRSVDQAYDELGVDLTRLVGGSAVLRWEAGTSVCR